MNCCVLYSRIVGSTSPSSGSSYENLLVHLKMLILLTLRIYLLFNVVLSLVTQLGPLQTKLSLPSSVQGKHVTVAHWEPSTPTMSTDL